MEKHSNIIIIGGGVAGLACASELRRQGKSDFILFTKEVGGRLCTSANQQVNYGAYILPSTDKQIGNIVQLTKKLRLFHLDFHSKNESYSFWQACRYWRDLLRIYPYIFFYRKRYKQFRQHAKRYGQKSAFEAFPLFSELYQTPAEVFIDQKGIRTLTERFLIEPVWMCTFAHVKQLNAFDFMHIVMHQHASP